MLEEELVRRSESVLRYRQASLRAGTRGQIILTAGVIAGGLLIYLGVMIPQARTPIFMGSAVLGLWGMGARKEFLVAAHNTRVADALDRAFPLSVKAIPIQATQGLPTGSPGVTPGVTQGLPTGSPGVTQGLPTGSLGVTQPLPNLRDISEDLGNNPRSAIIVGQPGAGKGRLVKHALAKLKIAHPKTQIWVIDPKQDRSEAHQWESADFVSSRQLPPFPDEAEIERFKEDTEGILSRFKLVRGPKLIVIDEAMSVKEVVGKKWFDRLMAGFNSLCAMGRSRKEWGWVISQSPNATDLGLSGGARNVYTRVLLIHAKDRGLLVNRSTFFSGVPKDSDFGPSDRAAYLSTTDSWSGLPTYD